MNWTVLIPVGIAIVALVIFLIVRNSKDEKDLKHEIENDYPKTTAEDSDIEIDNIPK